MELIKRDARSFGWWPQQLLCFGTCSRLYICHIVCLIYRQGYICLHLLQIECVVCLCFIVCFGEGYRITFAATWWHRFLAVTAFHLVVVIIIYRYIGKLPTAVVERQTDIECTKCITNQYQYAEYLFQNLQSNVAYFFICNCQILGCIYDCCRCRYNSGAVFSVVWLLHCLVRTNALIYAR